MSTNRIRYSKNADKSWTSVQTYTAGDRSIKVHMSPSMKEGAITDAASGDFLLTVKGKEHYITKRLLKKQLIAMGVTFEQEKREKSDGPEATTETT